MKLTLSVLMLFFSVAVSAQSQAFVTKVVGECVAKVDPPKAVQKWVASRREVVDLTQYNVSASYMKTTCESVDGRATLVEKEMPLTQVLEIDANDNNKLVVGRKTQLQMIPSRLEQLGREAKALCEDTRDTEAKNVVDVQQTPCAH